MKRHFSSLQGAVRAPAAGRVVVVLDSEERENEGDFLIAAERVTPETIYFMLRQGCGQLCVPVAPEIAGRLELEPLAPNHADPGGTAFAVPVDHRSCKTGISPEER